MTPGTARSDFPGFPWGAIQGVIGLPQGVAVGAQAAGAQAFADSDRAGFPEQVVPLNDKAPWMAECRTLLPRQALADMGFEPLSLGQFFSTAGVDRHEDDADGCVFVLALANDGLTFVQGKQRHVTQPGEWFIFHDFVPHLVKDKKTTTSYVFWHVPLRKMKAPSARKAQSAGGSRVSQPSAASPASVASGS